MLKQEVSAISQEVVELRRDFHMHPELGFKEFRTSGIVEKYLNDLGIPTERMGKGKTGVVGLIEGAKPGKTILLRADMDALPVEELTGLPYASQTKGVSHACGHDAHTAMLLCASKIINAHKDELAGTVKVVFQPNEEADDGAASMVRDGVLENPKVDESYAIHVFGLLPVGTIGIAAGPACGEMYNFIIRLHGRGGHTSTPHKSLDPILCMAHIIESVQMIQSREIDPMEATSIMFGKAHAGTQSNIIPAEAEMEGTIRYLYDGSDDGPQQPRKRFERIVKDVAAAHQIDCEVEFIPSSYVVINDECCVEYLKAEVFPKLSVPQIVRPHVVMGGDDFSDFSNLNNVPGAYFFLGTGDHELKTDYPQHSPHYNIAEDAMTTGVEIFVRTALPHIE